MYMRYTLIVTGDNFEPEKILNNIDTKLIDTGLNVDGIGDGRIDFMHKNIFSREYPDLEYDDEFINYLEKNHAVFLDYGADNFSILMDVYYADQCNFEIFNKALLAKLAKYEVSIPISVFYIGDEHV